MAENPITKEEVLKKFLVPLMYGKPGDWPKETVAACKIICTDKDDQKSVSPQVYRNDEKHAEVRLIEYLRWNVDILQARKIEIEVYMNYSPCSSCATTILDYVKEMKSKKKEIKMTIAFANFYKTHVYQGNTRANADDNIKGLQELIAYRERGVEMKLQLLGVHVRWETFLDMEDFFDNEANDDFSVNLRRRKKREEEDRRFWENKILTGSGVDDLTSAAANLNINDSSDN